jgi:hypothetical protein
MIMKYMLILMVTACCSLSGNHSTAQTAAVDNKLSQSITFRPIQKGPSVSGIFEGRPPCKGLAKQLKIATPADCEKLKCNLTLYQDPETMQPTTFALTIIGGGEVVKAADGSAYLQKVIKGKWTISKGVKGNPDAVVYGLEFDPGAYLYLVKGDENVLFVLDENKGFSVGNEDFSYTLNRVELVPGNK